jgi:hypothetical protein
MFTATNQATANVKIANKVERISRTGGVVNRITLTQIPGTISALERLGSDLEPVIRTAPRTLFSE